MPNASQIKLTVVVGGLLLMLAALAVYAFLLTGNNGKDGSFTIKFRNTELNIDVATKEVTIAQLIGQLFEGDRAEFVAAYLEQQAILYRYGSPALINRIKQDTREESESFAGELRDILTLGKGPFYCCHSFVNLERANAADQIVQLQYNHPVAKLIRTSARKLEGIFHYPGNDIQVGIFAGSQDTDSHPEGVAAACKEAEFYGRNIQLYVKGGGGTTLRVARPIDCEQDGFQWKDHPNLFLQIGLKDAKKVFGDRAYDITQKATIVIAPTGYVPFEPDLAQIEP